MESGVDAWQLLEWLRAPERAGWAAGTQTQLLARVFGEPFEVRAGQPTPASQERIVTEVASEVAAAVPAQSLSPEIHLTPVPAGTSSLIGFPAPEEPPVAPAPAMNPPVTGPAQAVPTPGPARVIEPKDKTQLASDRVQNPHEPEATYAAKGQGDKQKEHVGYKIQVAETVSEVTLAPGEPTANFLVGMLTHPAYESDEAGDLKMEQEQARMGWEKPPVKYVDGAYVSAEKLVQAQTEGRELIGPAQPAPQKEGRFSGADFQVNVPQRQAICPAGKTNTQCSRLEVEATGKVSFRFEFSTHCHDCPWRGRCLGPDQRHRTLVVGEHHDALQARRQEQQTPAFQQRMRHRNAIEGTQSELVRAHGLRHARYRGLAKVKLQNYFIGAACNVKRWLRREAWKLTQGVSTSAAPRAGAAAN